MIWYAPLSANGRLTVQAGVFDDEDDVDGIATETKIEVSHHLVHYVSCQYPLGICLASWTDARLRKIPLRLHDHPRPHPPNAPFPAHTLHRFLNDPT